MDKRTRALIDRAIAGFSGERDAPVYVDRQAPAVYRLEPPGAECAALACLRCQTVTVKPGAPRRDPTPMQCSSCGQVWILKPPAEVLAWGATGIRIVGTIAPDSPLN